MRYGRCTLGELTGLNYPKEVRVKAEELLLLLETPKQEAPPIGEYFEKEVPYFYKVRPPS